MERLAIIDHASHMLFIEDVSDEMLAKYNGDEEEYIKDNYDIGDDFSWEYITYAQYIPEGDDSEIYDIDFEQFRNK